LNSDVMSSHIVWRYFSPETHKNFHSGASSRPEPVFRYPEDPT
jgi:hypothetical protein